MGKCSVIMVTSCKGGVGKSTITANLALTLALAGKRTLMLDCDFGMRCLDLIAGYEDKVMYDICDIIVHNISFDKAIIRDERSENLFFCAAPYKYDNEIEVKDFKKFIKDVSNSLNLDYIIIDTHGGIGEEIKLAASVADCAFIIATHQPASIRAGEQTNLRLREYGVTNTRLIINCYDEKAVKRGDLPGIINIIDKTYIQLIGVIPADYKFTLAQRQGKLIDSFGHSDTVTAFSNIALRMEGYSVPLMVDFKRVNRKVILK